MRKKSESFYCFDSYLSVCLKDAVASDILLLKPFMTCPLTSYLMNPGLFYLGRECKCVSLCVVCVYLGVWVCLCKCHSACHACLCWVCVSVCVCVFMLCCVYVMVYVCFSGSDWESCTCYAVSTHLSSLS